jgi:hypothetical protein
VADERFMHTDPAYDLIGTTFHKMVFDIVEKDFVAIAGLHDFWNKFRGA